MSTSLGGRAILLLAIGLGAWGCQVSTTTTAATTAATTTLETSESLVFAGGSNIFFSETAQDWVTYATHVVQATVVADVELPLGEHEQEHQDGYIGRAATLRIDDLLWDSSYSDVQIPDTIELNVMGWSLNDGVRQPVVMGNSPRMVVGETYVIPLSVGPDGDGDWVILSFDVVFPVEDGILRPVRIPEGDESGVDYISARVDGQPPSFVSDLLADTEIDPRAAPFMDLPPYDRVQAVNG